MKKLLLFALLFTGVFTLAACPDDDEDTDQEQVDEAADSLLISNRDDIRGDFWVPSQGRHDTEITWESADPDIIEVTDETVGGETRLEVYRPEFGEGNAIVDLTATITKGDASAERTFDVTVIEQAEPLDAYDDFDELFEQDYSMGDGVAVEGVVVARREGGTYITDGSYTLFIYGTEEELGDKIQVQGSLDVWNDLYQVSDLDDIEVVSTGNDYDLDPVEKSIEDIYDLDFNDPRSLAQQYKIEGIVNDDHPEEGWVIESMESDKLMPFTFNNHDEVFDDVLDAYIGDPVEIVVHPGGNISAGILIVVDKDNHHIETIDLDEEALMELDIDDVESATYMSYENDIDLPEEGANGTTFSSWESSNTDYIDNDGTWVSQPEDNTELTFTADAEYEGIEDTFTDTVEITVTMPSEDPSESVDDALALEDGEIVHVEGVVTAVDPRYPDNFYIQDVEENVAIEINTPDEDWVEDIESGNKVSVFGELGRFTEHDNNTRQVHADYITTNDGEDHDLHIEEEMDQDEIVLAFDPFDDEPDHPGNNLSGRVFTLEDITLIRNQWGDGDEQWDVWVERIDEDLDEQFEDKDIDFLDYGLTLRRDYPVEDVFDPAEEFEDDMTVDSITFVIQRNHFDNIVMIPLDIDH